tara:strand:- start:643 stop:933 length:291 start_codon:yes stop_codon:yes gene_type:complete
MQSINLFKNEIAVLWEDGSSSIIKNLTLRKLCPCAFCSGETDALGKRYGGGKQTFDDNVFIVKYERVGYYGLQFFFSDGHKDGIYTFKFLKEHNEG